MSTQRKRVRAPATTDKQLSGTLREQYPILAHPLAAVAVLAMALFGLLFVIQDFVFSKDMDANLVLVSVRGASTATMLVLAVAILRNASARTFDNLVWVSGTLIVAISMLAQPTRPATYLYGTLTVLGIMMVHLFILPGPMGVRIVIPAILLGYEIWSLIFIKEAPASVKMVIIANLVTIFGIGLAFIRMSYRLQVLERNRQARVADRERFKSALADNNVDAVVLLKDNAIIDCNMAFVDLTGWDRESVLSGSVASELKLPVDGGSRRVILSCPAGTGPLVITPGRDDIGHPDIRSLVIRREQSMQSAPLPGSAAVQQAVSHLPLTPRERQIVNLTIDGYTRMEISDKLCISFDTVKKHTANIYGKLGINGKMELVSMLIRGGSAE